MYPVQSVAIAIALLAGFNNAAAIEERAGCSTGDSLLKLMMYLPEYATPFCKSAFNINPVTPLVTATTTPTV